MNMSSVQSPLMRLPAIIVLSLAVLTPHVVAQEARPDANAEKKDGEEKKDEKKDGEKKEDAGPAPIKREKPTEQAKPINTEIKWDKEAGAVQFSFHNQSWENVLQWIADASKLSFQWQELPGDALNLTTTRSYTLEEARDLLNRLLLSREYTMLVHGEILSVTKLSELKSSLVPRVKPDDLATLPDHSLVKVSFNLDWLIAEEAVEELQPMLTNAGKINKLSRTNRLEVIDTAISLREMWQILEDEQSETGQEQLVKKFELHHRRAGDVISMLRTLLGLKDPAGAAGGGAMNPQMMQQMQQQMQRMMQQAQQKGGGGGAAKEKLETRLVLNARENMIIARAAPDQMAIIEKAIAEIDVERESGRAMLQNMSRWKVHRMETVDPQILVDLLDELGDLDPGTTLKVDKDNKVIMAYASIADHLTIQTLVDKLDSTGREFDVIPLRRLDAEYVAGTIMTLMGPKEKKEDNSRNSWYSWYGRNNNDDEEEDTSFRVDADLQDNRLLVYANSVEMEEIHGLLQKLGELPDPDRHDNGYRVFELNPKDDANVIKKQLEQLWRRDNKLEFDVPEAREPEDEQQANEEDAVTQRRQLSTVTLVGINDTDESAVDESQPVEDDAEAARRREAEEFFRQKDRQEQAAAEDAPPVKISISEDGRLIVSCEDPAALAEIEDLMKRVARPSQSFKIFEIKHQSPYWVAATLEEYFAMDEEEEGYLDWWGRWRGGSSSKDDKHSLSKRRIPQFIWDNYTSTILVRDADPRQMKTIEELIEIYDAPSPADTRSMRVNRFFRLKNAKAQVVAQAVKDVFRDLLSSNDKALEKPGGGEKQQASRGFSGFGGSDSGDDEDDDVRFKGLLSIGVDHESNVLVISSQQRLMSVIEAMVEELDKAAEKSSGVRILQLDPSVDLQLIQQRLGQLMGAESNNGSRRNRKGQDEKQNPNGQPGQPAQPVPNAG